MELEKCHYVIPYFSPLTTLIVYNLPFTISLFSDFCGTQCVERRKIMGFSRSYAIIFPFISIRNTNNVLVIFVGDSGVGKTNLISRLTNGSFDLESKSTVGLVRSPSKIIPVGDTKIKVYLWDTGISSFHLSLLSFPSISLQANNNNNSSLSLFSTRGWCGRTLPYPLSSFPLFRRFPAYLD